MILVIANIVAAIGLLARTLWLAYVWQRSRDRRKLAGVFGSLAITLTMSAAAIDAPRIEWHHAAGPSLPIVYALVLLGFAALFASMFLLRSPRVRSV